MPLALLRSLVCCILIACLLCPSADARPFYSHLSGADIPWSSLTAADVANLTDAQIGSATAENISTIPPDACAGFKAEQLKALQPAACSGFRGECIGNMSDSSVAGFAPQCSNRWTNNAASGLRASQLANLQDDVFASLTKPAVNGLEDDTCAAITGPMLKLLASNAKDFPNVIDACAGLTQECIGFIPSDSFADLQKACSSYLKPDAWAGINGEQMARLSTQVIAAVTNTQLNALQPEACAGFQSSQLRVIPDAGAAGPATAPHACSALSSACVKAITPDAMSGITAECMSDLTTSAFQLLSADQLAKMTTNATSGITRKQLAVLKLCDALSEDQLASLGSYMKPYDTCAGFRSDCFAAIPADRIGAIQPSCFADIPPEGLTALDKDHVGGLSEYAIQRMSANQLKAIPVPACPGFTPAQVWLLGYSSPYDTCSGFQPNCLLTLTPSSFGALTSACFSAMPTDLLSSLPLEQIGSMSADAISGVTAEQIIEWTKKYELKFIADAWASPLQTRDMYDETLLGFKSAIYSGELKPEYSIPSHDAIDVSRVTSLQLAYCVASCMDVLLQPSSGGFGPNFLFLPLHTYVGLRSDQLAVIPATLFAQLDGGVLKQLLSDAISSLTPAQLRAIPSDEMTNLDLRSLNVNNGAVAALSLEQIHAIPYSQWLTQWRCTQFNVMAPAQKTAMGSARQQFDKNCASGPKPPPPEEKTYSQTVFIAAVAGAAGGGFILALLLACCCSRKRASDSMPLRDAAPYAMYTDDSSSTEYMSSGGLMIGAPAPVPVPQSANHSRRSSLIRVPPRSSSPSVSMRTPLHSSPPAVVASSPSRRSAYAPPYSHREIEQHLANDDDEEVDIGSRF